MALGIKPKHEVVMMLYLSFKHIFYAVRIELERQVLYNLYTL